MCSHNLPADRMFWNMLGVSCPLWATCCIISVLKHRAGEGLSVLFKDTSAGSHRIRVQTPDLLGLQSPVACFLSF